MIKAQDTSKVDPILNLHEGVLIVRIPTYTAKIDTLHAMIDRAKDAGAKQRLNKLLTETLATRDTFYAQYTRAFQNEYTFSKSAYFLDTDAHDLNTASYHAMNGERLAVADLSERPLFYLFFERTEESKIEAMVIYDRRLKKMPPPFPNNFAQGGLNLLIVKIAEKKFPEWRIGKMNKRMWKYYNEVKMNGAN